MDLYYIDHVSVSSRSWLHRVPTGVKMLAVVAVIGVLLSRESIPLQVSIAAAVVLLAISARVPMILFIPMSLYPVLFLAVLFLSIDRLTFAATLMLTLRVLAITGTVVLFFLTTSYPAIFGTLSRFLPGFVVAALFFTYRSVFVISDGLQNVRTALHLRGGFNWRHPVSTLRNLGTGLGHFLVHSIDASQRMADSLRLRGFRNRVYYLGGKR